MYRDLAVVYIYREHFDYTHATTLEGITDRTIQVSIFIFHTSACIYLASHRLYGISYR